MKQLIRAICIILQDEVYDIHEGYEMDCLISAEFTPAPSFGPVVEKAKQLCEKYGLDYQGFKEELALLSNSNRAPYGQYCIYRQTDIALGEGERQTSQNTNFF